MEYKGRITQIPAVLLTDERFLHLETTFKLFGDGVRGTELAARPMLEQMIASSVTGSGSLLHGSYDVSVAIGGLFDIEQAEKELKRTFERIVGWDAWFSASYTKGLLTFTFSRKLWETSFSGVYIIDFSEKRTDFIATPLGRQLAEACVKANDDKGVMIKDSRAFAVHANEDQLPLMLQKLNALFYPLLPKSGHTIKWVEQEKAEEGYTLSAIPPK